MDKVRALLLFCWNSFSDWPGVHGVRKCVKIISVSWVNVSFQDGGFINISAVISWTARDLWSRSLHVSEASSIITKCRINFPRAVLRAQLFMLNIFTADQIQAEHGGFIEESRSMLEGPEKQFLQTQWNYFPQARKLIKTFSPQFDAVYFFQRNFISAIS